MTDYKKLKERFERECAENSFKYMHEMIFTIIKEAIVSLELLPGDVLSESKLASTFTLSRTPIRQALQLLADIGLLGFSPQTGYTVTKIKWDEFRQLVHMRQAIEPTAAAILSETLTPEKLKTLNSSLKEIKHATQNNDFWHLENFLNLEFRFHKTLVDLSGNPFLIDAYREIEVPMKRVLHCFCFETSFQTTFRDSKDSLLKIGFYDTHDVIVRAICIRNSRFAHDTVHEHLNLMMLNIPKDEDSNAGSVPLRF